MELLMSTSECPKNRREFLKGCAAALLAAPALAAVARDASAQDPATLKPVDAASNPIASGQGYVHDATKADVVKFPKRKGPEGEKQFCNNCALYVQGGVKIPGSEEEWGKCILFPTNLVNAKGWCNSWAPKAS
jgi:hypothetical protein